MSRRHVAYLGRAGQLAVMAEVAERGWNVAVPEVDFGDDIIVLDDTTGALRRIQVKTARARPSPGGYSAKFKIGLAQLRTTRSPDLLYVFVVRHDGRWSHFIVLTRRALEREHFIHGVGNTCDRGEAVLVALFFEHHGVRAAVARRRGRPHVPRDFTRFVSSWDPQLPRLRLDAPLIQ